MQLMLSLETMGLSSCPLNWPDLDVPEKKMSTLLNLPAHKRPIMLISVGYAQVDGLIPYSSKKTSKSLRKEVNL
jgi:nitroreductase